MAQFQLGDRTFPRKGDAVDHIRQVLNSAEFGVTVTDPLVYALLDHHPEREGKVGRGVAGIEVHPDDWGQRCFKVRTGDGDLIAFSFRECFKPSTPAQNAKMAMRVEIAEQITAFRAVTPLVCAVTGLPLTNARGRRDTAEVDHCPPGTFDALAEAWSATQGGWGHVAHHQEGQRRRLTDADQRADWQRYHQDHATLRLLSAAAHRNVGGGASLTAKESR